MRPRRHDLNINFFTFRSWRQLDGRQLPLSPIRGRQAPSFENFPIQHIFLKFCFFLNIKMNKRPILPCGLKNWVFFIGAITISGVRIYAITIQLFQNMPLQFQVSPSHAIFYVSLGTGPTRKRTHTVGRPLWTHLPLHSRV